MHAELSGKDTEVIEALVAQLGSSKVLSSGASYEEARRVWNTAVIHRPPVIVLCETTGDVQTAVRTATAYKVPLSVRGAGHDWAGRSVRGGLVVDLSRMRSVAVEGQEASFGGGATSLDVAEAAHMHRLIPVTCSLGAVGMAGPTLGGGYGPVTARFGMASDNLVGAEVVTADGEVVLTDETLNPDLLWALRGGGGNFGVVTSFRVRLHPVAELSAGTVVFPWEQAASVAKAYAELAATAPDALTLTPVFTPDPDGNLTVTMLHAWCGERSEGERMLEKVKSLGEPSSVAVAWTSYVQMLKDAAAFVVDDVRALYRTVTLAELSSGAIEAILHACEARTSPLSYIVLHPFHGAGERIPPGSTAFWLRRKHFVVGIYAFWQHGEDAAHHAWADAAEAALMPYALPHAYPNYFGPDRPEQAAHAFGDNADRLLRIKARYDATRVFRATALPFPDAECLG